MRIPVTSLGLTQLDTLSGAKDFTPNPESRNYLKTSVALTVIPAQAGIQTHGTMSMAAGGITHSFLR